MTELAELSARPAARPAPSPPCGASQLRTIRCFPPTVAPRIFTVGQPKLDGWLLAGTGSAGLQLPPAASSVLDARNFSTGLTAEYVPCCAHRSPER